MPRDYPSVPQYSVGWCLAPLLPILTRLLLVARFHKQMPDVLSEEEDDRDQNRSVILALAGFSFAGVLAVALLDVALQQSFAQTVFFLLVSFLAYLWALNAQSYKALRWQGEMVDALIEVGSLSLVLSLISLLLRGNRPV